jgi:hypothetical protein
MSSFDQSGFTATSTLLGLTIGRASRFELNP